MNVKKHYISIPLIVNLSKETHNLKDSKFFTMRFHFMIKVREVEDLTRDGGILSVIESPELVGEERIVSIEIEKEYIDFEETLRSCLLEKETIEELESDLQMNASITDFFKVRNELKNKITDKIKVNVTDTFKQGNTVKNSKKIKFQNTTKFGANQTEKIYQIKQYQKCSFDIYLAFVDYLFVDYTKSFWGLRKKRKKSPKIDSALNHKRSNVLKINKPLASIHFWKLIEGTSVYKKHSVYKNEVPDPDEKIILPPEDNKKHFVELSKDIPSLYKLSSIAFPIKWIERNCDLSKDDLKKIEEEDYFSQWGN